MKKIIYILILIVVLAALGTYFSRGKATPPPKDNVREEQTQDPTLPPQAGLPEIVEAKRQAIYRAALTRDYDKLAALATYPNFAYSYGGPYESGFAGFMKLSEETEGESAFNIIPTLLKLPYSYSGGIYAWPSVTNKEPKDWTAEDIAMMKTFLTDEQIESYRQFGGYIYYRLGIDSNGEWIYYIAGD